MQTDFNFLVLSMKAEDHIKETVTLTITLKTSGS